MHRDDHEDPELEQQGRPSGGEPIEPSQPPPADPEELAERAARASEGSPERPDPAATEG